MKSLISFSYKNYLCNRYTYAR